MLWPAWRVLVGQGTRGSNFNSRKIANYGLAKQGFLFEMLVVHLTPEIAAFTAMLLSRRRQILNLLAARPKVKSFPHCVPRELPSLYLARIFGSCTRLISIPVKKSDSCLKGGPDEIASAKIDARACKIGHPFASQDFFPPGIKAEPVVLDQKKPKNLAHRVKRAFEPNDRKIVRQNPNRPFKVPAF
jgi:hypothetical protein